MGMIQAGFDINKLSEEAQSRWLKPVEVLYILQKHESFKITQKPPQKPPSGSLFLFNRRVLRYFRNDGYSWQKKKNGKTAREGHERLKVGNSEAINCYYARGEKNSCIQRRSYWMLDPAYEHIALVHYREIIEGRNVPESTSSISNESSLTLRYGTSVSNDQAQCFPSHTSEFNEPCQNSCSPGSVEEVNSIFDRGSNGTTLLNGMERSESCHELRLPEINIALRNIEEQLSLDTDDEDSFVCSKTELLRCSNQNVETHGLQILNHETRNPQEETHRNSFDEFKQMSNGHIEDSMHNLLNNSDNLRWLHGSPFQQSYSSEADYYVANHSCMKLGTDEAPISAENSAFASYHSDIWYEQSQFEVPFGTEPSLTVPQGHLFTIREVSPEWAFSSENTKVLITGNFLCSPSECAWAVLFGDIEVPLEIVQDGVLRCRSPQHMAGKVKLCITSGNGKPCSEVHEFVFQEKQERTSSSRALSPADAIKSSNELLLLVNLVQILFSGHSTVVSQLEREQEVNPSWEKKRLKNQLELIIESILVESEPPEVIINLVLQELLKNKLQHWLTSKHEGNPDEGSVLSKHEQCIIHVISGLGYRWALHPILNSGTCINYRDSNGWTALHWAARFGREEMVAALLAAGASAGAVTNPTSEDPAGKTPASLAVDNGHKGLAGYLSEAALTTHLFSLTTEKTKILEGSASMEADRGVDNIYERRAHLQGGTEDQLSLKDSLAAVRNATQAAARIQAAFRAYSFRKNIQKTDILQGIYDIFPTEVHGLSVASRSHKTLFGYHDQKFDKAAVSIQKNYRRWRRRKEFIKLRVNVVKIQTHVRAHLAKKKEKEFLWSVGILEKIMLRWYRKGVGLRGFRAELEPIDVEEEDDVIKVFRKQRVNKALDEALSRVISVVENPEARLQYRRMLETYQQAKAELSQCG
uniref:CG-1 domain-containing protein n=1 Tax=Musa acuminata subsp. malaccensis TaxID=214687 RepID=A0A804K1F6_MUSAM|nr:PREDICTED: calmodulin-binding transcription activator 4 isoform X1 [Musa acuminata subsp. malaccensis]